MKLLERNIASVAQRLVLLAPSGASIPEGFRNLASDAARHRELVREMQMLRGSIYLRDGAVERRRLAPDGTHRTPEDEKSWHLLMLDVDRRVSACAWYMPHDSSVEVDQLRVRNCPLAHSEDSAGMLRTAVQAELARARREGIGFAEVGGWAVEKERGCHSEGLVLALAGYSLARLHGGALGMTTATVRHCSSTILRRLGGSSLRAENDSIPPYYDPVYRCSMELLRFDSRHPNSRYAGMIEQLCDRLADVLVITPPLASCAADVAGRRDRSASPQAAA